ncbi:MAG TPA: serine/threonine-protein kinase [Chloroflexota bacterium]|jgi:serine/threonine protein kinase
MHGVLANRYLILELVGTGGVSRVYRALDLRTNTLVAVKHLLTHAPAVHARFEREADLLARLRHPSIPEAHGYYVEGGERLLVMRFVPGPDLGEQLACRGRPFSVGSVLEWAAQLLEVLMYLHGQGVVHHDIKPRNIKLDAGGRVVLLDFGLASEEVSASAHDGTTGYTASYSPPEQVRGAPTDPRSDLYALGATLYELLARRSPPPALQRIADGADPLEPLEALNPNVPASLAATVHAALHLDKDKRPPHAQAMHAAVLEALDACGREIPDAAPPVRHPGDVVPRGRAWSLARTTIVRTPDLALV